MILAPVNKIIKSSVVDGPGNRCAIFLQGCNFNCMYCHNPETINNCFNCGKCVDTCPANALSIIDNKVVWDDKKCVDCDTCIKTCDHNASPKIKYMNALDVMEVVKECMPFIKGITTSGGECSLHKDFLVELFTLAKKENLSCLIDSNGSLDYSSEDFKELIDLADGVMLDVKAINNDIHLKVIGQSNETVIKNDHRDHHGGAYGSDARHPGLRDRSAVVRLHQRSQGVLRRSFLSGSGRLHAAQGQRQPRRPQQKRGRRIRLQRRKSRLPRL